MMTKKTDPVSVRMPPELKDRLQALAEADRRSLSTYIVMALEAHVAKAERRCRPKA